MVFVFEIQWCVQIMGYVVLLYLERSTKSLIFMMKNTLSDKARCLCTQTLSNQPVLDINKAICFLLFYYYYRIFSFVHVSIFFLSLIYLLRLNALFLEQYNGLDNKNNKKTLFNFNFQIQLKIKFIMGFLFLSHYLPLKMKLIHFL